MAILDLGAGTGYLLMEVWRELRESLPRSLRADAALHFVDTSIPCCSRYFGLSRKAPGISSIEWTTADYRDLLDDENWLSNNGPFDWVFSIRLLDNVSSFEIEPISEPFHDEDLQDNSFLPHQQLAPRRGRSGIAQLAVRPVWRIMNDGKTMPQFSLNDYFMAMRMVMTKSLDAAREGTTHLPIRRFNPASLITKAGRSIIAQLMKVSKAIIIEDVDLDPVNLKAHKERFGLIDTAAVHCVRDGFRTDSYHYIITKPNWAERFRGERLW
ncbi:MAG: class I SAM-dependent methyltransferase [Planctomycetota bacterium]